MSNTHSNPSQFLWTCIILIFFYHCSCQTTPTCAIDPICFQGCSNSNCVYDTSLNRFYNSSIEDTTTEYSGPSCCQGCNSGYFLWMDMKTCSQVCNVVSNLITYGNPLTRTCNFVCPDPFFGDNLTTRCVSACPNGSWASIIQNQCVAYCPMDFPYHYTANNTCLSFCSGSNFLFTGENLRKMCALQCPQGLFGDKVSGTCVDKCPTGQSRTFAYPPTRTCQERCFGEYPYANLPTGICVSTCPLNVLTLIQQYGQKQTSTCVTTCQPNTYSHPTTKACVTQCFDPQSEINYTNNSCQIPTITVSNETPGKLLICVTVSGIVILVVVLVAFYRFYLRKRLVRRPWKYDVLRDIQFSL